MIRDIVRNWSLLVLLILGGVVVLNNADSDEINANSKFHSAPTLSFSYW